MSDGSRLILALDLVDVGRALRMAQDISPHCFAIKVNWPIILHAGPQIIREISRFSRVICDLKLADIPNTNRLIVERVRELGAWGVIAHSFVGQDSLRAVVEAAGDMKVFSVVAMSHPGASDLLNRFHDMLIDISMKAGVYGFVAPGNNEAVLRQIRARAGGMKIISPGIGAQGGDEVSAVAAGADYVIVGRKIYQASDPVKVAMEIDQRLSMML